MKRWFKLVTVLCCSITFIIGLQINVNAEEVISSIDMETSIVDDDNDLFLNDILIQIQDDSAALVQDQIDVLENETEEEIESAIEDDILELEEEDDETEVTIFSGTITDYLSATNDYDLYSVPLSQGNYLQARLSVPSDININYDLLLYDANFNLIKFSDYLTVLDGYGPLADSIGYVASGEQTLYLCVYSVSGGSASLPYNLDFSISSQNLESSEPDENVKEATQLNLGTTGATVTRVINSALDSDWYKFTVQDNPGYSKMRFQVTPNTTTGSIKLEVYKNLVSTANIYAMANVIAGDGGEQALDPGDYYIRVVSTKNVNTFTTDDIIPYQLKVTPVATPTALAINRLEDYNGNSIFVEYNEGELFRVERDQYGNTFIRVYGRATYYSNENGLRGAANVIINGTVINEDMLDAGMMNATTYGSAITDESGYFTMVINLANGIGHNVSLTSGGFIHRYDNMNLTLEVYGLPTVTASRQFYLYVCTVN